MTPEFHQSTREVARTYDLVYEWQNTHGPIMGTDVDPDYNINTKETLAQGCLGAPAGRPFLEVGTGNGNFGPFMEKYHPDRVWFGLDFSIVGLIAAKNHFRQIRPVNGEMLNFPFEDEQIGAVIFADALEHSNDIPTTLAEAYRVLTPGGILVASVPTPDSLNKWKRNALRQTKFTLIFRAMLAAARRIRLFGRVDIQPEDHHLSEKEWVKYFADAGFKVEPPTQWPTENGLTPVVQLFRAYKGD